MTVVLTSILPIFSLIVIGYLAGRFAYVSETTSAGLADFTFKLAIPALLFRTIATANLPDVSPFAVWASYFAAVFTVWAIATVLSTLVLRRAVGDTASISMSSGFGNVVMLGIPLSISLHGEAAAGSIALIIAAHSPILWTLATVHNALVNRDGKTELRDVFRRAATDLSRNTIILAILAALAWRATGLEVHGLALGIFKMLGAAAIPCALVSLGLSLFGFRIAGQVPTLGLILVLKLAALPLLAAVLAFSVFDLPPVTAAVVVIFAAMPTGANAYLFASQVGRAVNSASGAVVLATLLSIFTSTLLLLLLAA